MDGTGREAPQSLEFMGVRLWPGWLDRPEQEAIVADIREMAGDAPFRQYSTRRGQALSVRMTAAGARGWMTDRKGYRYEDRQPDGAAWPDIPPRILNVWRALSGVSRDPDSCLVNFYGEGARMGLHQDRDEAELDWPVLSISLGDDALFRVGGPERGDPTRSVWLKSGDIALLSGLARLHHHGIDRIKFKSSDLLPKGGRLNLTLRVAGPT